MPANYAHHRFGEQIFQSLPPQIRKPVQRFRPLFDVGLHGPDIFFYYNPFFKTAAGELGSQFHRESGQIFFGRICEMLRNSPSEAATAYLYGLLGHYCLDSVCHPFVNAEAEEGRIGHVEMEIEFDRYLMTLDKLPSPHTQDLSGYFRLTRGECVTVSEFYPPATPAQIHQSVGNTRFFVKFLAGKNRRLLKAIVSPFGDTIQQQLMHDPANHKCLHLNKVLLALYDQALERYPVLLEQLTSHMENGTPLGEDFEPSFG